MSRLFLLVAALVAVIAAPLAMPAMAAAVPMEHCDEGHTPPGGGDHDKKAMDHQACCVAVDPGKASDPAAMAWSGSPLRSPVIDDTLVHKASGIDPPPPRAAVR